MPTRRHSRYPAEQWQAWIDEQSRSGLSQQVFCEQKGLAMDETPIKAGRKAKGKMKEAWFWPLYGDHDEISFTFSPSRARAHIDKVLDQHFEGVLLTDGNASYARYAEKRPGVTHAQCWAHARRHFEKAQGSDEAVEEGLLRIAGIYAIETWIREKGRDGPDELKARTEYSEPWVKALAMMRRATLPGRPRTQAPAAPSGRVRDEAAAEPGGVPVRSRRVDRHQPSRTRAALLPHGKA